MDPVNSSVIKVTEPLGSQSNNTAKAAWLCKGRRCSNGRQGIYNRGELKELGLSLNVRFVVTMQLALEFGSSVLFHQ
jgi:hypothetical protein